MYTYVGYIHDIYIQPSHAAVDHNALLLNPGHLIDLISGVGLLNISAPAEDSTY